MQPDLFDLPLLAGLSYAPDLLTVEEEAALIGNIDALPLTPFRFQGWTGKRLTLSLGWSYDFEKGSFDEAEPMPDWLKPLKDRAARFAGLAETDLVQALLTRYDPGAGIGWHRDRPVFDHVLGISLGAAATLRFRKRTAKGFDRFAMPLAPRSIYHLAGLARHEWEHGIAATDTRRWSVTFRSLSAKGRRQADL
ncbi:MAG TPA: alpha-ketoglutarate-dependent dioxygenase AlkB [Sphingobium sp.]|nr:alpha-ketoglutarate-dependent dioxygenase AlkB [Sphingobium sp.]